MSQPSSCDDRDVVPVLFEVRDERRKIASFGSHAFNVARELPSTEARRRGGLRQTSNEVADRSAGTLDSSTVLRAFLNHSTSRVIDPDFGNDRLQREAEPESGAKKFVRR